MSSGRPRLAREVLAEDPADQLPVAELELDRRGLLVPDEPALAPYVLGPDQGENRVAANSKLVDRVAALEVLVALERPLLRVVEPAPHAARGADLDLGVQESGEPLDVTATQRLEDLARQLGPGLCHPRSIACAQAAGGPCSGGRGGAGGRDSPRDWIAFAPGSRRPGTRLAAKPTSPTSTSRSGQPTMLPSGVESLRSDPAITRKLNRPMPPT